MHASLIASMLATMACGAPSAEPSPRASAASIGASPEDAFELRPASLSMNGLSMNGLSEEGISQSGLSDSGIATSPLTFDSLAENVVFRRWRTEKPALSSEVLTYLARCALKADQTLRVPGVGAAAPESFQGALGLAPTWMTSALRVDGQELVSACLMAHVNAKGAHVTISLRGTAGALTSTTTSSEVTRYAEMEGAFYGNLFLTTPTRHVCSASTMLASGRSAAGRVCTDSGACGFTLDGGCDDVCLTVEPSASDGAAGYSVFTNCKGHANVVTTYLEP